MNKEYKKKWSDYEIISLAEVYYSKFELERQKLPYWVNLVDVIGANENAHTKILQMLLSYKSENKYPIFDSFTRHFTPNRKEFNSMGVYLFKLNHTFTICEGKEERRRYSDIYIYPLDHKSGVSIIIENKINFAEDRIGQVEDYIKGMYDDRNDNNPNNSPNNNCYAFYLISEISSCKRDDGEHDKKGRQKVKDNILGRYIADDHYILLTYNEDILPWLKEVLRSTQYKEKYLIQNIELYVSYLENRFNMRENINKIQLNILHNMEEINTLNLHEIIELRKALEAISKKQKIELLNCFENLIRKNLSDQICADKGNNEYYKGFYVYINNDVPLSLYCELNLIEDKPDFSIGIAEDDRIERVDLTENLKKEVKNKSERLSMGFSEILENRGLEDGYYPKFSFYNLTYKNVGSILQNKLPEIISTFKEVFLSSGENVRTV